MTWMSITCGQCGATSTIDEWTTTAVAGELPRNMYQCPKCRYAFERRMGKAQVFQSGFVMPGPVSLVPVQGRL